MLAGTPVILLKEGTSRESGPDAQRENLLAARAIANAIRTTLGPRGLDKMLVDSVGDAVITNDGATILRKMEIQNPAGQILAEVAQAQDVECGDGTKSSVILAGELVHKAEELLYERVHPTAIVQGYRMAAETAVGWLERLGEPVGPEDVPTLRRIAMTAMVSKGVADFREALAPLAVDAVRGVLDTASGRPLFDRRNIQIVKRPGESILDSELVAGRVLDQGAVHPDMPRRASPARLALVEGPLEVRKTEFDAEIRITKPEQLQSFAAEEERSLREMADAVRASGANTVVVEKGLDEAVAESLAHAGLYAVRRVPRKDLEMLAKATGGRIAVRATDLAPSDLGSAECVEERRIGDARLTFVTGCVHPRSVAILVRGGSEHVVDEAERSLVDAVSTVGVALEDGRALTGAGAWAVELARRLRQFGLGVGGREQMAVRAFADALEVLPATLAENAGMDDLDTLVELRRQHSEGNARAGVDVLRGGVADMGDTATEPMRVARQILEGATSAATTLLRVDDVISAHRSGSGPARPKPAAREDDRD